VTRIPRVVSGKLALDGSRNVVLPGTVVAGSTSFGL
jgi:hypothetical protein